MNIKNLKFSVISGLIVTLIATFQVIVVAPIIISSVGSSVYGAWVVVADLLMVLQIFDFGITAYSAQKIAVARINNEYNKCCANFFATLTIVLFLIIILIIIFKYIYINFTFPVELPPESEKYLRECVIIGVASVCIQLLSYSFVAPSRALEKLFVINVAAISGALLSLGVTLMLLKLNFGLYAMAFGLLSRSLCNLIGGLISIYMLRSIVGRKNFNKKIYFNAMIDQTKTAPLTFTGNMSLLALSASESFLVGRFSGFDNVTIYSVTRKIFDFCKTIIDIFSYSLYGGLSSEIGKLPENSRSSYLHHYTAIVIIMMASLVIPAYALSDVFVKFWVGIDKYAGLKVAAFIAFASFLAGVSGFLFSGLRARGNFRAATLSVSIELLIKIALAVFLIPVFEIYGIAGASIIASITSITISIYVTNPESFVEQLIHRKKLLLMLAIGAIFSYLSIHELNIFFDYSLKFLCISMSTIVFFIIYSRLR